MPGKYIEERRYNEGIELDFPIPPPSQQQPGTLVAPGASPVNGQVTLEEFGADQNDLNLPEGFSFRLSTDGVARTITGFANVRPGRIVYLHNVAGGANILIANQNAGSTEQFRTITGTGASVTIAPDKSGAIIYDGDETVRRWRVLFLSP